VVVVGGRRDIDPRSLHQNVENETGLGKIKNPAANAKRHRQRQTASLALPLSLPSPAVLDCSCMTAPFLFVMNWCHE
jgi:hypothetical protein